MACAAVNAATRAEKIRYPNGGRNINSSSQKSKKTLTNVKDTLKEFMKLLSVANECVIDKGEYTGPSPDEIELVKFSKNVGFELINDKPL